MSKGKNVRDLTTQVKKYLFLLFDIPEKITVDLSGLQIGDTVTISSVDLPTGAKPTIDRDFVIANIAAPKGLGSDDADEPDAAEASETVDEVADE